MNLLFGHDQTVAEWAEKKFARKQSPWFRAVGVIDETGTLVGAAVFRDWNGANIEASYYGPASLTPAIIRGLASFLFIDLGVVRVTVRTLRKNRMMQKALRKFGFRFEGVSHHYFGEGKRNDAINFALLKSGARRFLRG